MSRPFPDTIERKRELHAAILREGGGPLMDEVKRLQGLFPGARLTHIKVGNVDVGLSLNTSVEAFDESHEAMKLHRSVERKLNPPAEVVVAKVAASRRNTAIKRMKK